MRHNKVILTDCDGVLLEWIDAFIRYMEHLGYTWDKEAGEPQQYNMAPHFGIKIEDEMVEHIMNFNHGHWEFGTLNPLAGAKEALFELVDMGYRFTAISSCSTAPQTIALRKANLYNHFGDVFDAVHCIDVGESKRTHLADHEPTFWIEDNFENCVDGLQYGHKCILMHRKWNENSENAKINRCYSWEEIVDFIKENQDFSNIRT